MVIEYRKRVPVFKVYKNLSQATQAINKTLYMKIYELIFCVDKNFLSFYYYVIMVVKTGGNGYVQKPSVLKTICCLVTVFVPPVHGL